MAVCYEYKGQTFESKKDLERFMMEEYLGLYSEVSSTPQTETIEINEQESRVITSYPKEIKTENNTYQSDKLLQVLKEFDETYDDGTIADQRFEDEPLKSYGMSDKNFEFAKNNKDLLEKIILENEESLITDTVKDVLEKNAIKKDRNQLDFFSETNKETPQAETAEDSSQLSMDELRAKFAEEQRNKGGLPSDFSPTEEIFNRGNKTSHSFLKNFFVENSQEFFNTLSGILGTFSMYNKVDFLNIRPNKEELAKAILRKTKLRGTKNLISDDSLTDVMRILGYMVSGERAAIAYDEDARTIYDNSLKNFSKLSLAKKINLFKNAFKDDTVAYDSFLKYIEVNTYINPENNKYHETVIFKNPGDKVTMDTLMDSFEMALLDPDAYAEAFNMNIKKARAIQSIAKDLVLYDLAVNNFEFAYGAISKLFSAEVVKEDLPFLNSTIAHAFDNTNLKVAASEITEMDMYDESEEFIPSMRLDDDRVLDKRLKGTKDYEDKRKEIANDEEKFYFIDSISDNDTGRKISVIEKNIERSSDPIDLPPIIKTYNSDERRFDYFVKGNSGFNEGFFVTNYQRVNNIVDPTIREVVKTKGVLPSSFKKTTGKNILNDQMQPLLGQMLFKDDNTSKAFVPNRFVIKSMKDYEIDIKPTYQKNDDVDIYQSVNQIATTSRSRSIEQITKDSEKLKKIFEKAGVKVNIVFDENIEEKGTAQWNGDKEVTITINPVLATDDTSPHEFSHIFADIVGVDHPVMKRAIAFLKGTKLWKEVQRAYPHLSGDNLAKEVISTAMGIAAAKKLNKEELSKWQRIKNGIKAFFKRLFNFKSMNPVDELVKMMYEDDISGYTAKFELEQSLPGWQQINIDDLDGINSHGTVDSAMLDELQRQAENEVYNFSSDKVIDSIYIQMKNKKNTLTRQGRPTRFIDQTLKQMRKEAGDDLQMIVALKQYHDSLKSRIRNLYDFSMKEMNDKVRKGNLTEEEEARLSNALYELSDNLKTIRNLSKYFAPYVKMWRKHYSLEKRNEKLADGHPNKKTEEELILSLFNEDGLFEGEDKLDLFGFNRPETKEGMMEKFQNARNVAYLGDIARDIDRIQTELYGDGENKEGILREYMNRKLIPLSSNPDFVSGEIKSLFKLRKTRYTLPYDETSIQMWLDALKDTNNPFVALAIKNYYEGLFLSKKRSQAKIKEYKKKVAEFKAKGFSMDSLVDESGRFIDEINYEAYLKIREKHLVKGEGSTDKLSSAANFFMKYHTWHPNYDEIKQEMIDTYGEDSDEYLEWFNKNHGETKKGKLYPMGSMSVPDPSVAEIRNEKYFQLRKNKEWAKFRDYMSDLVRSQKGTLHSQLLDEGFIPAIPLKGDSIIEEIKESADGFKESVKKLGKHFKGKFLPNVEEDSENKQYIITDEDNNIVDTVPIPFLKFLSKEERPSFDSSKINSKEYLAEYNRKKEEYNIKRRREQGALVNKNLELTMEVFIGMTENFNYKKKQTSSLLLMRELVKNTALHRNKGLAEIFDLTNKKTTGKDVSSKTDATNLLEHVDRWLKMVHYEKFDFSDQEWQRNVARVLMTVTSISSLGLNAFSAFNNVAYGNIQLFTERMAGEFFTTKSWKKASAIANKLPFYNFSNKPDDKDAVIASYFDVVERGQELGDKKGGPIKENDTKEKIINALFAFQNGGEIQMQNATLFSVLMETPVKIENENGSITDGYLYDQMKNIDGNIFIPENVKVKAENGEWVVADKRQLARIRQKTYSINQYMHGIYNKEDAGTINKSWIGRLATHFKKWMRPGFNRRFGSRFGQTFWNESRESLDEGMYVGTAKFLAGVFKNAKTGESMSAQFQQLDKKQQSNIIRTGVEMSAALSLGALAFVLAKIIEGLEPEEDEYLGLYAMHYMTQRLYREQLTYSFRANTEAKKTIQAPIASWRFVGDTVRSMGHVMGIPFAGTFMEDIFGNPYYQAGYKKGEHKGIYKLKQMIPLAKTYMQYKSLDDTFEIRKQQ